MTPVEILDACTHLEQQMRGYVDQPRGACYACAGRAIAAAVEVEREVIEKLVTDSARLIHRDADRSSPKPPSMVGAAALDAIAKHIRARGSR